MKSVRSPANKAGWASALCCDPSIVRHWPDFFIILLLLVTNAVVGFWEERQAGNEIAALKALVEIDAIAALGG